MQQDLPPEPDPISRRSAAKAPLLALGAATGIVAVIFVSYLMQDPSEYEPLDTSEYLPTPTATEEVFDPYGIYFEYSNEDIHTASCSNWMTFSFEERESFIPTLYQREYNRYGADTETVPPLATLDSQKFQIAITNICDLDSYDQIGLDWAAARAYRLTDLYKLKPQTTQQ
jgi:hypothetical protein